MAENKTKATENSVDDYIAAIADDARRQDCEVLIQLMSKATKQPAVMWGDSIVGFGNYHYRYESGREGDICLVGFSSRKGDISLYGLFAAARHAELVANLGKSKSGKGCLYIRRLSEIDLQVLETLINEAADSKDKSRC
ncbi:DUF1801 domain-containing protein [Undibacterium pigrum]|uniref:Uncharacterized protein DUF1801 n=1 Tax=Undibacterium pigrum TaxID=401470 RepID=A0A318J2A0_9BURK|nr:DUF1801 domain-containing protein [Undibacterium pigrum]PXX42665.1 uncharacterized protein DUF1801 [Undibacterium pigrum]